MLLFSNKSSINFPTQLICCGILVFVCLDKSIPITNHPWKGFINIQNIDDNECFKWCLIRCLHSRYHNPKRITKADKDFAKKLDFKDIKCPVNVRDIHKIEKKNSIGIRVFGYENKEKYPIYVSKNCCEEKHVDLLLIGEEGKRH